MSASTPRLSVIVEWANARLKGESRAVLLLDALARQWRQIVRGEVPAALPAAARRFLVGLEPRSELVLVSGDTAGIALDAEFEKRLSQSFDLTLRVADGLEYYPLKNFGAGLATGDLLLFVDSDVLPDEGWLAHLLGTLADPGVDVACGQTYVTPSDLVARAFALSWIFSLRDDSEALVQPSKIFTNNLLFRTGVFRLTEFPSIGHRSRGAGSLLRENLERLGITIWENQQACVGHSAPSSVRNMIVRALAHGRDHYMKHSEERTLQSLGYSLSVAARRLQRGFVRTFHDRRRVALRRREVPAALAIILAYYAFFAIGGVLTYIHPRAMARRFRI